MIAKAERLNKRITIQQQSTTQDSYGEPVEVWNDVTNIWASIEPINGKEFFAAEQVNAEIDTRIRTRYIAGFTPAMRALYGTRLFNILSVIDYQEQHKELELMCRELV